MNQLQIIEIESRCAVRAAGNVDDARWRIGFRGCGQLVEEQQRQREVVQVIQRKGAFDLFGRERAFEKHGAGVVDEDIDRRHARPQSMREVAYGILTREISDFPRDDAPSALAHDSRCCGRSLGFIAPYHHHRRSSVHERAHRRLANPITRAGHDNCLSDQCFLGRRHSAPFPFTLAWSPPPTFRAALVIPYDH